MITLSCKLVLYQFQKYKISLEVIIMEHDTKRINLRKIKEELKRRLIVMRYSEVTINHYMMVIGWLEKFLEGYGEEYYSQEMGQRFIAEYRLQGNHAPTLFQCAKTAIRRIDEVIENKSFTPCFRETAEKCPPRFFDWYSKYIEHLENRKYSKSTITTRRRYAGQLLGRLPETVLSLGDLTATDLYNTFTQHEWPSVSLSTARCLFAYLFKNGVTEADMSVCVPRPRRPRSLPSIYSAYEVTRLLSSVDCNTSMGKRDYAILMLASHLGLRSSDIVNLSFSDIDHVSKSIEIVQVKSERPITLVMNSDVEDAITDYIQNGRPQSSSDKIFIGTQAPYAPISAGSGYAVVRRYFDIAGIAAQGRRRGPHALRASFATALVGQGVPYAVVQEALGHEDPESAKHYVRVDVRRLRSCALDVPKPIGAFAMMLNDLEGVL
jgi:site-specific recombinase XerD